MSIVACSFPKTGPILYPVVEVLLPKLPIPLEKVSFPVRGESKAWPSLRQFTLCSYSDKVNQEHSPSIDRVEHWKISYFPVLKMKTSSYSIVSFEDRYLLFAYTYMWQMNKKENRELDRKEGQAGLVACEERLANKRTNKSSISCSCSSS